MKKQAAPSEAACRGYDILRPGCQRPASKAGTTGRARPIGLVVNALPFILGQARQRLRGYESRPLAHARGLFALGPIRPAAKAAFKKRGS